MHQTVAGGLAERLYRALLVFQRRRGIRKRVIAKENLSLLAVRILGYLDCSPQTAAVELEKIWNAERSVISRTLAKLQRRRLIASSPTPDGRKKNLSITDQGRHLIHQIDAELTGITNQALGGLDAGEREDLSLLLESFANELSRISALDPTIRHRATEHPMNFALMRISMCGGMYGGRYFGSALTVSQAQVLDVVSLHEHGIDISKLGREIASEQSSTSRIAGQLVRSGLLSKQSSDRDRRISLLFETDKGTKAFLTHCRVVASSFAPALDALPSSDQDRMCDLLDRAENAKSGRVGAVLQEKIEVRRLRSEDDRATARGFIVLQAVRRRTHRQLPETLVPKNGCTLGLFINDQLQGVCDCVRAKRRWEVRTFSIASELDTLTLRAQFQKACREYVANDEEGMALIFT